MAQALRWWPSSRYSAAISEQSMGANRPKRIQGKARVTQGKGVGGHHHIAG